MVRTPGDEDGVPATLVFAETVPLEAAADVRASESGVLSTLSGSLRQDLHRFTDSAMAADLLPAIAASVRHVRPIAVVVSLAGRSSALVIDPRSQAFLCDTDLLSLAAAELAGLRLERVDSGSSPVAPHGPLRPAPLPELLWRVALYGSTDELLPEIGGRAMYRAATSMRLPGALLSPEHLRVLARLSGTPSSLAELQALPGDGAQVRRVLNALYLQGSLIVTRLMTARPRNYGSRMQRSG